VQLVLDDQIRGSQSRYLLRMRGGVLALRGVDALATDLLGHVRVPEAVPFTRAADAAEQQRRLPVQRELRKLVDRPDDQRWGEPVHLFIDRDDRQALPVRVALLAAERAQSVRVRTVEKDATAVVVAVGVFRRDRQRTPRAGDELDRQ